MMLRPRVLIIIFMLISLLADQGLYSGTRKKAVSRPRHAKTRHVKHNKETPRPPDPALAWSGSPGNNLVEIFNNDITATRIAPVKGEVSDIAVHGEHIYALVKNFNFVSDAIFTIRKETGKIAAIWGIGRLGAEAIACDGSSIWILSRSEKYFIRKLTLSGKQAGAAGVKSLPEGSLRGLACAGGVCAFAVRRDGGSALCLFDPSTRRLKEIGSFRGQVGGVASWRGCLVAYLNEFDLYSDHWLLVYGPSGEMKKKMHFVESAPDALAGDGTRLYVMSKGGNGVVVSPVALLMDANLVLAGPAVRRVEVTIPVTGRNRAPYAADLWVPYPLDRPFQNVRQVSIEPAPREITEDRFGNRWARIRFEGAAEDARAVIRFDIITAAVAYTVESGAAFEPGEVPAPVRSSSLGETSALDLSHYVVQSHAANISGNGSCLSRVLAIRDYVHDAIRFTAYGDRWVKASDYLFRGRGDAYGQTLGFAALSRIHGIPARAAGGLAIGGTVKECEPEGAATWNQVYIPGNGWVDLGIGRDYGGARDLFAGRPGGYCVMFEGDFDASDYRTVFAETEWSRVCRWSGTDENSGADVMTGPVAITVRDLKE